MFSSPSSYCALTPELLYPTTAEVVSCNRGHLKRSFFSSESPLFEMKPMIRGILGWLRGTEFIFVMRSGVSSPLEALRSQKHLLGTSANLFFHSSMPNIIAIIWLTATQSMMAIPELFSSHSMIYKNFFSLYFSALSGFIVKDNSPSFNSLLMIVGSFEAKFKPLNSL